MQKFNNAKIGTDEKTENLIMKAGNNAKRK